MDISFKVFVMYPPITLKPRDCDDVLLFVIWSFTIFEPFDVTESFGLSYVFITLFESSKSLADS